MSLGAAGVAAAGRASFTRVFAHCEVLHSNIATSRARLLDDEGHISLLTNRLGDIINDLVEPAGTGRR